MGLQDVAALIEADARAQVMRGTWGHLAPEENRTYPGRIVFAIPVYSELNPEPIFCEFDGLDDSPWFFDHLHKFLQDTQSKAYPKIEFKAGTVYEWRGKFKNYRFIGRRFKKLLEVK